MSRPRSPTPGRPWTLSPLLFITLFAIFLPTNAIKFALQAYRYPPAKCIWNPAHINALVIVTANVGPGQNQRVDIEIVDSSPQKNVYLSKKGIKAETRLAITAHSEGEVGVCFRNYLYHGAFIGGILSSQIDIQFFFVTVDVSYEQAPKMSRIIDLDVDIGADAVDYKYVLLLNSYSKSTS